MTDTPITLAGNLPKDEQYNGLEQVRKQLLDEPIELRYAVVAFDVDTEKIKHSAGGERTPTIRIRRIEPAVNEAERTDIQKMLDGLTNGRIGALPFDENEGDENDADDDDS